MNYEQKYKEALKVIESLYNIVRYQSSSDALLTCQTIEQAFPELRESEDEKWRNWLIGHLKGYINQTDDKYAEVCKEAIAWLENPSEQSFVDADEDWYGFIRWFVKERTDNYTLIPSDDDIHNWGNIILNHARKLLEKQGEQKPSWSEEDEKIYQSILDDTVTETQLDDKQITWLKSLKDRVQQQPKHEWSEEDERQRERVVSLLKGWLSTFKETYYAKDCKCGVAWLESIKERMKGK